jgi:mannosyltransferase OCH1-like enzyme
MPFDRSTPIPRQLWQTSKSKELNERANNLRNTWTSTNPAHKATLMNDTESAAFIASYYGPEVAALYAAYPLGVMRADFWRYAVLYIQGGVYADIDTECLRPVEQWLPAGHRPSGSAKFVSEDSNWKSAGDLQYHNFTWDDCSMVVGLENDAHMCQWSMASAPGHPVLRAVLNQALKSLDNGIDCEYEHLVHRHTGPAVWTSGSKAALGLPDNYSAADVARAVWTDAAVYGRARAMRLCIVASEFFAGQNVRNHYSSQWGDDAPNTPWTAENDRLRAAAKSAAAAAAAQSNGTATD